MVQTEMRKRLALPEYFEKNARIESEMRACSHRKNARIESEMGACSHLEPHDAMRACSHLEPLHDMVKVVFLYDFFSKK